MSRDEIVERFTLESVERQPGDVRLREARLDERRLPARAVADATTRTVSSCGSASRGSTGRPSACTRQRRSCRRRSGASTSSRASPGSCSTTSSRIRRCSTRASCARPHDALEPVEPWAAAEIEAALKQLCEELGEKPRTVYGPIRVAVTGSKISPGLYESLELLGRDRALERIRRGAEAGD